MILYKFFVYLLCFKLFKLVLSKNDIFKLNITNSGSPKVSKNFELFSKLGLITDNPERRILGGEIVQNIKDFPFMAHLTLQINDTAAVNCGGSIIGPSHVLTAAHCIQFCKKVDNEFKCTEPMKQGSRVYIGNTVAEYASQESLVKTWHIHPEYKYETDNCFAPFDIGIVELEQPLEFSEDISTVALPEPVTLGEDDLSSTKTSKYTKAGKTCKVLGWGMSSLSDKEDNLAKKLKVAAVPLIGVSECLKLSRICAETQICSLDPKNETGTCFGDSGGPVICDGYQIGILSSGGKTCVGPLVATVYTRVDISMKFIKDVMKGNASRPPNSSNSMIKLFYLICIVFSSLFLTL